MHFYCLLIGTMYLFHPLNVLITIIINIIIIIIIIIQFQQNVKYVLLFFSNPYFKIYFSLFGTFSIFFFFFFLPFIHLMPSSHCTILALALLTCFAKSQTNARNRIIKEAICENQRRIAYVREIFDMLNIWTCRRFKSCCVNWVWLKKTLAMNYSQWESKIQGKIQREVWGVVIWNVDTDRVVGDSSYCKVSV